MINTTAYIQPYTFTPGAAPATFNVPFAYQNTSEIYATLSQTGHTGLPLTPGVDFSMTPPSPTGGTMTRLTTWNAAYGTITIYRYTAKVNAEDLVDGGGVLADRLEYVIDELTQMIQETTGQAIPVSNMVLSFPLTDPAGLNYQAPAVAIRALQSLIFDAAGSVAVGAPANANINAAWQAGLAQSTVIALQIALGLIPAGSTIDKMQFDMENRHIVGEYVWLDDYKAPSQYDPANPANHFAGLFLGDGADHTITAAHWPLGVTHMRAIPLAYQRGQGTEVTGFAASGWSITTNVVTVTFTNTAPENAMLAALAEELLAHGNTFTGWRTITVPALAAAVPAGDYAITGLSAGSRTITFAYTVGNTSGGAVTVNFYAYRVAGSTTSALVYKANGVTLSNVSDSDEETPYSQLNEKIIGLRKRSRGQGHNHLWNGNNSIAGAGSNSGPLTTQNITNQNSSVIMGPVTDTVNGTPRVGKTTEMRQLGAALHLWLGRYLT